MTASPALLTYQGDGEFRAATRGVAAHCDKHYTIHETYPMVVEVGRSRISHDHFFAAVEDVWLTLPDHLATEFTSADRLRYRALIATGWYTEKRLATSSPAEARKFAAFLMNDAAENVVIAVSGAVVIKRTARTQKTRGPDRMLKADFQKSKQDCLDWIAALIGIEPDALASNTRRSPSITPEAPTDTRELAHVGRGRARSEAT